VVPPHEQDVGMTQVVPRTCKQRMLLGAANNVRIDTAEKVV
jgi:hypothetical protein